MQANHDALPIENPIHSPEQTKHVHWMTIAQLLLSIMAGLGFCGLALSFAALGVFMYVGSPGTEMSNMAMNTGSIFLVAAGLFWMGMLVLPSAYYAGKRLARPTELFSPVEHPISLIWLIVSVGIMLISLWLGKTFSEQGFFIAFVLPILHILAISIPIYWITFIGCSGIPLLRSPRMWGALMASLTIGPLVIMLLEMVVIFIMVIVAGVLVFSQPAWMDEIAHIGMRMTQAVDQAAVERIIMPYMVKPAVMLPLLVFLAVIVPLIEEAVKPIGVWLLLPAGLNGRQGFVIGLICGAGYALFESLLMAAALGDWVSIVLARAATGLLHIANCGLVGWALAEAFGVKPRHKGSIGRLFGAYLLAVTLHGLWNGLTVFGFWVELAENNIGDYPVWLMELGRAAPYGVSIIALAAFCILWYENIIMRRRLALSKLVAADEGDTHIT